MSVVAKLMAGIGINTDEFKKGMGDVGRETSTAKKNFSNLGRQIAAAFSIGAIVAFTRRLKDLAIEINKSAAESGSTTTGFQSLQKAMADAGYSAGQAGSYLSKLQSAMIEAMAGGGLMRDAFESLGITMDQMEGKATDEVFGLLGEKIVESKGSTEAYDAVLDLFGKRMAANLLPTLRMVGEEGFGNLTARMKESGVVMNEEFIARMIDIDTRIDSTGKRLTNWVIGTVDAIGAIITAGIVGVQSLFSDESFGEAFGRGFDAYFADRNEAIDELIEKQREANKNLKEGMEAAGDAAEGAADRIVDAFDEIAAAALDATNTQWAALLQAEKKYQSAVEKNRADNLSAEDELAEAIALRARLMQQVAELEENRNKYTKEWYNQSTQIFELTGKIEKLNREVARSAGDAGDVIQKDGKLNVDITEAQVASLGDLQALLARMTDKELNAFILGVNKLHQGIGNLDFSGLAGLAAITGLKIPDATTTQAGQFARAMERLSRGLQGVQLPDLEGLKWLKDFEIPDDTAGEAGQFADAIARLVKDLSSADLDLDPLQKVADLFTALKGGEIRLVVAAPSRDQMMLEVDESFKSDLSSLAADVKTLAGLKGIIYD